MNIGLNVSDEEKDYIQNKIMEFDYQFLSEDVRELRVAARSDDGQLRGVLLARTFWKYLQISTLWVEPQFRRSGVGLGLITRTEMEAKAHGCLRSTVSTFDFQARAFYEVSGYSIIGTLDGFGDKYSLHHMVKRL